MENSPKNLNTVWLLTFPIYCLGFCSILFPNLLTSLFPYATYGSIVACLRHKSIQDLVLCVLRVDDLIRFYDQYLLNGSLKMA